MGTSRKRVTNMSDILKESQTFNEIAKKEEPEQKEQEQPSQEQPAAQVQPATVPAPENNNTTLLQNNNVVKTKRRKTDERDAKMYYLDPGQADKLDELRREYKIKTGKKLNEQDFMRHIVNRVSIDMLL